MLPKSWPCTEWDKLVTARKITLETRLTRHFKLQDRGKHYRLSLVWLSFGKYFWIESGFFLFCVTISRNWYLGPTKVVRLTPFLAWFRSLSCCVSCAFSPERRRNWRQVTTTAREAGTTSTGEAGATGATTSTGEAGAGIENKSTSDWNSTGASSLNRDVIEDDRIYFEKQKSKIGYLIRNYVMFMITAWFFWSHDSMWWFWIITFLIIFLTSWCFERFCWDRVTIPTEHVTPIDYVDLWIPNWTHYQCG